MRKIISIIKEIIMWAAILFAFAAIGFASDNPYRTSIIWIIIAIVIFGVGFFIKKHTKRKTVTTKAHIIARKIIGIILVLIACYLPVMVFGNVGFPFITLLLIFIFAAVLIALGALAVLIINKYGGFMSFVGYLLMLIVAFLPALAMSGYDLSYSALSTVYYLLLLLAIFSWLGLSMIFAKKIE
ncbi:MAG TPA: hypothetical protein ENG70_06160 [Candidatus Cloacimonetes bacterium]|nr:hypothetical protein [Candidatus Cloacimonadota bacterium]HEX38416.1 hypothetical protein [Candidatus Cloacimonadota bacterium]